MLYGKQFGNSINYIHIKLLKTCNWIKHKCMINKIHQDPISKYTKDK